MCVCVCVSVDHLVYVFVYHVICFKCHLLYGHIINLLYDCIVATGERSI